MMSRIAELQQLVKAADGLKVSSSLINYAGVLEYYPEELVITVKSSTTIAELQTALAKHNQALPFFVKSPQQSIGAAFALGAEDLSDAVLGVKIIDGTGELLFSKWFKNLNVKYSLIKAFATF
ncbi:MAG: FAD-binding protein, partial [Candidatus Thioglobus sp.]|nr:FAD-binding protein [Candidatus Thioglobus sp.]